MCEKVEKVRADFHKFSPVLKLFARLHGNGNRTRMHTTSIVARQRRARFAQTDSAGHERHECEVSTQTAASRAKPRHRGTGCRGCVDASDFETRQTSDAKGGPRLRQDATDEYAPDDGVENT